MFRLTLRVLQRPRTPQSPRREGRARLMAKKADAKTNACRMLDAAGLAHILHEVTADATLPGTEIARRAGEDPDHVFKTLVTVGRSGQHYVFMVPVAAELDLKKAAAAAGEKSIAMVHARELLGLTGYVHGGCSPLGMKKAFPTFIDETCELYDTILFSGGRIGLQVEMAFSDLATMLDITVADLTVI